MRDTWLTPYGEAWRARWGEESEPPWGEMAKSFKAGEIKIGAVELAARWKRFLAAHTSPDFCRPIRFLQGLGQWRTDSLAGVKTRDQLEEWLTRRSEKEIAEWDALKEKRH